MYISVARARDKLSQLLQTAKQEPIIITRRGKPAGVLIPFEEYEELRKQRAYLEMLRLAEELRDCGVTAQELHHASRAELEARD